MENVTMDSGGTKKRVRDAFRDYRRETMTRTRPEWTSYARYKNSNNVSLSNRRNTPANKIVENDYPAAIAAAAIDKNIL